MVIAEGTPEQIAVDPRSYTGEFLRPLLAGREVPVGDANRPWCAEPIEHAGPASGSKRGRRLKDGHRRAALAARAS